MNQEISKLTIELGYIERDRRIFERSISKEKKKGDKKPKKNFKIVKKQLNPQSLGPIANRNLSLKQLKDLIADIFSQK